MRIEFHRDDLPLSIRAAGDGEGEIRVGGPEPRAERFFLGAVDVVGAIEAALARLRAGRGDFEQVSTPPTGAIVRRVTVELFIDELHGLAWERLLAPVLSAAEAERVVRVSSVPPRVAERPMALPMRILLAGLVNGEAAVHGIRALFGSRPDANVDAAVLAAATEMSRLDDLRAPFGWPTVDVLHLGRLPRFAGSPVAWLGRLAALWQTRLIVLDASDEQELRTARDLGAALVGRGGPGVIVRPVGTPVVRVHERLIHDFPLDVLDVPSFYMGRELPVLDAVFGGAGREDAVRVSNVGEAVVALARRVSPVRRARRSPGPRRVRSPRPAESLGAAESHRRERAVRAHAAPIVLKRPRPIQEVKAGAALSEFAQKYGPYTFAFHETDGLIPMAAELQTLWSRIRPVAATAAAPSPATRHVNGSLRRHGVLVNPARERLVAGEPYSLRIEVGARDEALPVWGDTRLFEDAFEWTPEMDGVWIEVAVSGVGFAVEHDQVQELWLPREGPAGPVAFAVRPVDTGAGVLRYTLYYRQNVVQTFRIAALVRSRDEAVPRTIRKRDREVLARALNTAADELPLATWIARREYDSGCLDAIERVPARTVSLVANHVGERRILTVKGEDFFVDADADAGDVSRHVDEVRTALYDASVEKITKFPEDWPYAFANEAKSDKRLEEVLPKLALAGWQLYDRILPARVRERLEQPDVLGGTGAKIAVAHVLLEQVIPWAVMYDRMFADDAPVQVCRAALEQQPDGSLGAIACGSIPACLLRQPTADETYIACPLRFWGFRHVIEIPPKQVEQTTVRESPGQASPPPAPSAGTRPRLVAVVNAALKSAGDHLKELAKLKTRNSADVQWEVEQQPSNVLKALADADLDIAYFYCHARGTAGDPKLKACVEFTDLVTNRPQQYTADRFHAGRWKHKPLVFINGCSTAAFTADALAPFIRKFARDREAGGIVGTEMAVPEQLARAVALRFLERFLTGEEAGAALLAVRHSLLAEKNPLGLAYTLYAPAELTIDDSEPPS
ncbi:MAG TPA: CHAT domain-containing protein [Thermoanaerobaculia bacterium]